MSESEAKNHNYDEEKNDESDGIEDEHEDFDHYVEDEVEEHIVFLSYLIIKSKDKKGEKYE